MNNIYVQSGGAADFDRFLRFAKERGYNIEITTFAFSNVLDGNWKELVKNHKQKLKGFRGEVSLHGAFLDLATTSEDEKILAICKERFLHNLRIANRLGAKIVIFHIDFNPMTRDIVYPDRWTRREIEFMRGIVDVAKKHKITIVLENMWEPGPEILKRVIKGVNSPYLKAVLDTGHANVFSKVPIQKWVGVLGNDLVYLHLNDNKGDFDAELPLGKGNINWKKLFFELNKLEKLPRLCLEIEGKLDKLTNTIKSIEYLKKNKLI